MSDLTLGTQLCYLPTDNERYVTTEHKQPTRSSERGGAANMGALGAGSEEGQ